MPHHPSARHRTVLPPCAGQPKECYIYRFACTGSIDETILQRQTQKGGLLDMLDRGKLPPSHSRDRDQLFGLDEETTASRLHERLPSDSPYADAGLWAHVDLSESATRRSSVPESWLRRLCQRATADLAAHGNAWGSTSTRQAGSAL